MINSDIVKEFKNAFKAWEAKRVQVKDVVQLLRRPPFSLRDRFKKLDHFVPKPNGEVR